MPKKNILCIAPYSFLPAQSGGQKAIVLLYQYLSQRVQLTCISVRSNQQEEKLPYDTAFIFSPSFFRYINPFYFFSIKKIISQKSIDTIWIEHPYMGLLALMLQWSTGKKFVVRSHNIESIRFKTIGKWWWKILWYYEKFIHQKAAHSFFITEEDRLFAIKNYGLKSHKTSVLTFGTTLKTPLSIDEKKHSVETLKTALQIPKHHGLLSFVGSYDYQPNLQALELLVHTIFPTLIEKNPHYHLLVCGRNIPSSLMQKAHKQIIFKGFVEDIYSVFAGTEIFLNPVWQGGGIKTKLVEALCFSASAVSFQQGAIGVPIELTKNKMLVVEDVNTDAFVEAIIALDLAKQEPTSTDFFQHFYWGAIAQKAQEILEK